MGRPDLTVLVVDDDFRVANLHASLVESIDGFTVGGTANTAAQAREQLSEGSFDLALVDVYLPDGSGIELVSEIPCDAIILSAAAEGAAVRAALAAGALGYLIKPFPRTALVSRLAGYARYRKIVDGPAPLTQPELDAAIEALRVSPARPAPVSQSVTRNLVLQAVRDSPQPMSAGEVATAIGISRATAQRYLAASTTSGRLRMQLRYGTTGRPEQEYCPPTQ
jgi:response regulator of citrate/malate metabolism